jgi:predicted transcriptional regulator
MWRLEMQSSYFRIGDGRKLCSDDALAQTSCFCMQRQYGRVVLKKPDRGYTKSMKTAVSIPDDVFEGAERLARRTKKSRSQLFSDAVREYVARHAPEDVTDAMDRVCAELENPADKFVSSAAHSVLERTEC